MWVGVSVSVCKWWMWECVCVSVSVWMGVSDVCVSVSVWVCVSDDRVWECVCKCKSECVCAGRAEQLVMTLSSPCYSADRELLGVAAVDLTLADMFAGAEHFAEGELSYAFVIDQNGQCLCCLLSFIITV